MMKFFNIDSSCRDELIDITTTLESSIPDDTKEGVCHVFIQHTTAGVTINENADPSVKKDILMNLNELIDWSNPKFTHLEGNSAAHLKASFMGFSVSVPFQNGRLLLGTWQSIYFCEFDGPRKRKICVQWLKS